MIGAFLYVLGNAITFPQTVKRVGVYRSVIVGGMMNCIGYFCVTLPKSNDTGHMWLSFLIVYFCGTHGAALISPAMPTLLASFATEHNRGKVLGVGGLFD